MKHEMSIKSLPRMFLAAGFMLATTLNAFAAEMKIIANPSVSAASVSVAEMRSIFCCKGEPGKTDLRLSLWSKNEGQFMTPS